VMNEVLDNLPARLVQRDGGRWSEVLVDASEDILAFRSSTADDDLSAWCDAHLSAAPDGALLAAQIAMERWVGDLVGRFPRGHLCIIDYAADTATLARRRRSDVVRAFHRQRSGMDVLDRPGTTDITVDVNTEVLVSAVRAAGARVTLQDQARFLGDLGAGDVLASNTEISHERARAGDVMGQLQARSEATNLRALITVPGFGGFTVFLVRWGD
jgi:SAM-dependent MidA family methyltransferase